MRSAPISSSPAARPIGGLHCVQMLEPLDTMHGWDDNYLCSNKDIGLAWSSSGTIAGKRCQQIYEGAEASTTGWTDNFLCVESSTQAQFSYTENGSRQGLNCLNFAEPSDPMAWVDNFLCWSEPEVIIGDTEANSARFFAIGSGNRVFEKPGGASWNTCPLGYSLLGTQFDSNGYWLCARNDLRTTTFYVGDVTNNAGRYFSVNSAGSTYLGGQGWDYCQNGSTLLGRVFDVNGIWVCMQHELPWGFIDSAGRTGVCGWAMDPQHRGEPVDVQGYVDGNYVGHTFTDQPRPDVNNAHNATGNHGYCIPYTMGPGAHSVVVRAVDLDGAGSSQLAQSPWTVQ